MKVFLSWSGNESKQLAEIFKEWLPNVLQYVDPYMSAQDISLGERWNNNISGNLEESDFGLVFVTPMNINAPWINYEAGALSKTLDSKVIPILYNADVMILNQGPLKQFQSAKNLEKDSILSLLKSINSSNKNGQLDQLRLIKSFEMWWTDLKEAIEAIVKEDSSDGATSDTEPTEKELLSIIYSKITEQEKLLVRDQNRSHLKVPDSIIRDLYVTYQVFETFKENFHGGFEDMETGLRRLSRVIRFLQTRSKTGQLEDFGEVTEV
ncbi:toll/interleukin-1 receptor domain-containing protein [Peribacillus frigoritolerans]|uniref:toll/interleukin-1 receptor domain-containing protein n=1 Tax=Peribacillus frigoritolerans TaxID=450367 RepID=UPI001F503F92|nr:toll/interleukin-1 receptor domain-containing protein [Peribacillus frigoritolerans]MCK2020516.1 toll/interleukin-1 receptor domain-containing protein [Peribacillus frigoritolerans]